jgi:nucleoside-diphosphate-sugar epimerase
MKPEILNLKAVDLSKVKSLLITGANGFVGQAIVQKLASISDTQLPQEILFVTRNGLDEELSKKLSSISRVVCQDLTKPWQIKCESTHVINLAADGSRAPYSKESSDSFREIGRNLISWIKKFDHEVQLFHASSGACFNIPDSKSLQFANPNKFSFIQSRLQVEDEFEKLSEKSDHKVSIARLFTFSGNLILKKNQYAITDFIKSALTKKLITVTGNPHSIRSYLHEDSMATWVLRALVNPGITDLLQIGSNEPVSIKQLAEFIADQTAADVDFASESVPADIYLPRNQDTISALGVEEGIPWKTAIQNMIQAERKN